VKLEVNENSEIILKEVYSGIGFVSDAGEELNICMRDSGFEIFYEGYWWEAKEGEIFMSKPPVSNNTDTPINGG